MNENASKNEIKKTELNEEEIVSLFKKEASSFVPNKLDEIAFETYEAPEPIFDDSFLKNRIHLESEEIIPNVQNEVLKATKAAHPFMCWLHHNSAVAFSLTAAFLIAMGAASTALGLHIRSDILANRGAFVAMRISPAETNDDQNENSNPYSLFFTYQVDKEGKTIANSLRANNYSARLLSKEIKSQAIDEATFAASLLSPAYEKGYMKKSEKSNPNQISLLYFSVEDNVKEKQEQYAKAFDKALKKSENGLGIYASLSFRSGIQEKEKSILKNADEQKKHSLAEVYVGFATKDDGNLIDMESLSQESDDTLSIMASSLRSVRKSALSPCTLDGVIRGTASAYHSSKEKRGSFRKEIEAKKNQFMGMVNYDDLSYMGSEDSVRSLLAKDAAYTIQFPSECQMDESKKESLSLYNDIRLLINKNLDKEGFISLVQEEKEIADSALTFFDASKALQNEEGVDTGNHLSSITNDWLEDGGILSD